MGEGTQFRVETDLLGEVLVPSSVAYGAQTQRAIENFPLCGEKRFADYPELLKAMLQIKMAAAFANLRANQIEEKIAMAIIATTDNLLQDIPDELFPVHSFHGGGGVSFNMNVNEVIANLANLSGFGNPFGSYDPIHPNDHVNLNQSTNDVFASSCHFAIMARWRRLEQELAKLSAAITELGEKNEDTLKISRTCLQDAVEISYRDFLGGYSSFVDRAKTRTAAMVDQLFYVNMGGTMVGRAEDADSGYQKQIIPALRQVLNEGRIERSEDLFDSSQNLDDMVAVGSQLQLLARGLIKIGKDLRLMASGPQTGFGEIELPALQPGSSAMPGKVNPSVPEFLIQSCFQAIGHCSSAEMVLDHGELDLNVWEATVVTNLLDAMACLENGACIFRVDCVDGININLDKNKSNIHSIIPLMTKIKNQKGYAFATRAYKETGGDFNALQKLLQ